MHAIQFAKSIKVIAAVMAPRLCRESELNFDNQCILGNLLH